MKKFLFLVAPLLFLFCIANAQTVLIPNQKFRSYLLTTYPNCMTANGYLDTTCAGSLAPHAMNLTSMNQNNQYVDFDGIQYFDSVTSIIGNPDVNTFLVDYQSNWPDLTPLVMLDTLMIVGARIDINTLPSQIRFINFYYCEFVDHANIVPTNQYTSNNINLPSNLRHAGLNSPSIVINTSNINTLPYHIPQLPTQLEYLSINNFTDSTFVWPAIPTTLKVLRCKQNYLSTVPAVAGLEELDCNQNLLIQLPYYPNMKRLNIGLNWNMGVFPTFSSTITHLNMNSVVNWSTPFPNGFSWPPLLKELSCDYTQFPAAGLAPLPDSLEILHCTNGNISSLPALPITLKSLSCSYCNSLILPSMLPPQLEYLECISIDTSNHCLPILPNSLETLYVSNTITCLPNIPTNPNFFTSLPICIPSDPLNNPYNCTNSYAITGVVYADSNLNCIKNFNEPGFQNIPIKLYDTSQNLLQQSISSQNGSVGFNVPTGIYVIAFDTTNFITTCTANTIQDTLNGSLGGLFNYFNVQCKNGFDVGAQSVVTQGWVFPGLQHTVHVTAGDLSQWNGFNCSSGISGQVLINVSGPVIYVSAAPNSLTPTSVLGNTFTYNIPDFGLVNFNTDFRLIFQTDTLAQSGDDVCVSVMVTPLISDNDTSNNNLNYCYQVVNSYDPNEKKVYPESINPSYDGFFTYTIYFQNTGNAPAMNIKLLDTLDNDLDLSSFQVLNYSHSNVVNLNGNILQIKFNNIMLPDSFSNEPLSHGFFQYKIKAKDSLPLNMSIDNTASIYFDYNAPIVTNTVSTTYAIPLSSSEVLNDNNIVLYPNPADKVINILHADPTSLKTLFNSLGVKILSTYNNQIDVSNLPKGLYLIKCNDEVRKIVVN